MLDLLDQAIRTGVITGMVYQAFSFAKYYIGASLVRHAIDRREGVIAVELARTLQPGLPRRRRDDDDQAV